MRQRARRAGSILRGLAALSILAALIIGLPVLLLKTGGSPVPHHFPSWHQVSSALLRRDDGTLFLAAVRDISWLGWAAFTLVTLAEAQAAVRGRQAPRLAGLGGMQNVAGRLVALARMRRRQRQNRREGRRIPLPAHTATLRVEQRLRSRVPPEHLQALILRAALRELATGIIDAGASLPGIADLHVTPELLEALLTSPQPPHHPPRSPSHPGGRACAGR